MEDISLSGCERGIKSMELLDVEMLEDYLWTHGIYVVTPQALKLAKVLWKEGESYAEIAAEIASQDV